MRYPRATNRTVSRKQTIGELTIPGKDVRVVKLVTVADQGRMVASGHKGMI